MQRLVVGIALVQRQDFVPKHALYLRRRRRKGVIGHVGLMIVGLLQVADAGQSRIWYSEKGPGGVIEHR